jgi:geranylgeranyl reductase family protein
LPDTRRRTALRVGKFDVTVVGAGPAGSTAALTLSSAGARVALVDKATFPRDKACGDLVGPRAVALLEQLGIQVRGALPVGDMLVVGPNRRSVRLRCRGGLSYPGYALASRRIDLDSAIRTAALDAGAVPVEGQVVSTERDGSVTTLGTADGKVIECDAVIGADGATSRVADSSGLVDRSKVQWGFAVRTYLEVGVALPTIVLWERSPWSAVPGYGWVFPSPDGGSNAGVGVGTLSERKGADAVKLLEPFLDHIAGLGLFHGDVEKTGAATRRVLGGWLKMGMVGTMPARGATLLVGDAAGLVNPLQGEGITQALTSGRAAALAVLGNPGKPADSYRRALANVHLPYHRITADVQRAMVTRPRLISAVGRVLTAPVVGRALASGWGLYWNELLDGSTPGLARTVALCAQAAGRAATARTSTRRWFDEAYGASMSETGWTC